MLVRGIDYYELLGVARDASQDEIRSAYRALAKAMHPDAGGTAGAFRLLREAYETLVDPARRADYDRGDEPEYAPEDLAPPRPRRAARARTEPAHEPALPVLPVLRPDTIPWWDEVRRDRRVVLTPTAGPSQAVALGAAVGAGALVLLLAVVGAPAWLVIVVLLAGLATAVEVGRRHLAAQRVDREFTAEFGDRVVFGRPGAEDDELAERLTAELFDRYLRRVPGVRIFHGLATEEGSVFADLDHAVLCGRRLVLVESKLWLPGHYEVDENGEVLRNGHRFRGGAVRLPAHLAAYRALLPDVELRGVLLIYPSRAGQITVGDGVAHTPERFVREIGDWLATDPSTVDRELFRIVLRQVVTTG
ncbi:DnaJ domain-containing protein [Actinophytocola sp.]|uniref:J domain-containing protein n=1 Tax=Actinophytocola sp. TaxID=1872138 RepID=UPI00389B2E56